MMMGKKNLGRANPSGGGGGDKFGALIIQPLLGVGRLCGNIQRL